VAGLLTHLSASRRLCDVTELTLQDGRICRSFVGFCKSLVGMADEPPMTDLFNQPSTKLSRLVCPTELTHA
jgi:hypothetical protein